MAEYWRPIPGYGGYYEISNFGRVRNWMKLGGIRGGKFAKRCRGDKPRIISQAFCRLHDRWDLQVKLRDGDTCKPISVKKLMRDVWMDGPIPGKVVSFRNGDPKHCALSNLYYTTKGELNKKQIHNRVAVKKVRVSDGEILDVYPSIRAAAKGNYITESGMHNRIREKRVIDGVRFMRER